VLYVHLAYCLDLQELFGPNGWLDSQAVASFRSEAPIMGPSTSWEDVKPLLPQSAAEEAYMTRWGANPRQTAGQGHSIWSAWFHVTDPVWMWVVHAGFLTAMLCFAAGFCTRVAAVLTWIGLQSYIQRTPVALFGMDTMMNLIVLYLMIGPSGAAFSVDRLLAGRRARREGWSLAGPQPSISANLAIRLLQVHFCIIYLAAGLSKLQGVSWWNGTAVWGTLANYEFCPVRIPVYLEMLRFLAAHRWLWELVMSTGTVFTLVFEIGFPFLVWNRRLRWLFIVGAVLLHGSIAVCMGLVSFSMMMLTGVASFVPPQVVNNFVLKVVRNTHPT
jgi:hypothetical protein